MPAARREQPHDPSDGPPRAAHLRTPRGAAPREPRRSTLRGTLRVSAGPDRPAAAALAGVGAALVPGHLQERLVRHRLTRAGAERAETAVVLVGLTAAAATGVLGARAGRAQAPSARP